MIENYGANSNSPNENLITNFIKNKNMFEYLLSKGAIVTTDQNSIVMASKVNDIDMVKYLLQFSYHEDYINDAVFKLIKCIYCYQQIDDMNCMISIF